MALAERHYGLEPGATEGPERAAKITAVRMWLICLIKRLRPDFSLPRMGRMFGGRDHTTIMHTLRKNVPRPRWSRDYSREITRLRVRR